MLIEGRMFKKLCLCVFILSGALLSFSARAMDSNLFMSKVQEELFDAIKGNKLDKCKDAYSRGASLGFEDIHTGHNALSLALSLVVKGEINADIVHWILENISPPKQTVTNAELELSQSYQSEFQSEMESKTEEYSIKSEEFKEADTTDSNKNVKTRGTRSQSATSSTPTSRTLQRKPTIHGNMNGKADFNTAPNIDPRLPFQHIATSSLPNFGSTPILSLGHSQLTNSAPQLTVTHAQSSPITQSTTSTTTTVTSNGVTNSNSPTNTNSPTSSSKIPRRTLSAEKRSKKIFTVPKLTLTSSAKKKIHSESSDSEGSVGSPVSSDRELSPIGSPKNSPKDSPNSSESAQYSPHQNSPHQNSPHESTPRKKNRSNSINLLRRKRSVEPQKIHSSPRPVRVEIPVLEHVSVNSGNHFHVVLEHIVDVKECLAILQKLYEQFQKYGYDLNVYLNAGNGQHRTPLHFAVESGHADVVHWLLEHGATVTPTLFLIETLYYQGTTEGYSAGVGPNYDILALLLLYTPTIVESDLQFCLMDKYQFKELLKIFESLGKEEKQAVIAFILLWGPIRSFSELKEVINTGLSNYIISKQTHERVEKELL